MTEDSTSSSTGLFSLLSGAMGEILQNWGFNLNALKKKAWATIPMGPKSRQFSHSSNSIPEQIELSHFNVKYKIDLESSEKSRQQIASLYDNVERAETCLNESFRKSFNDCRRSIHCNLNKMPLKPRHSFHEGSLSEYDIITTLAIHTIKYSSRQRCFEPHCFVCFQNYVDDCDFLDSVTKSRNLTYTIEKANISEMKVSEFTENFCSKNSCQNPSSNIQIRCLNKHYNSPVSSQCDTLHDVSSFTENSFEIGSFTSEASTSLDQYLTPEMSSVSCSYECEIANSSEYGISNRTLSSDCSDSKNDLTLSPSDTISNDSNDTATLSDILEFKSKTYGSSTCFADLSDDSYSFDYSNIKFASKLQDNRRSSQIYNRLKSKPYVLNSDQSCASLYAIIENSLPVRMGLHLQNFTSEQPNSTHLIKASSLLHLSSDENQFYLRVEGGRPGQGHYFKPVTLERPAWCDACAHLVFYHAITCANCGLTCHEQCECVVSLDCKVIYGDSNDDDTSNGDDQSNQSMVIYSLAEENCGNNSANEQINNKNDSILKNFDYEIEKHQAKTEDEVDSCQNSFSENSTLRQTTNRIQSNIVSQSQIEHWVKNHPISDVGLKISKEGEEGFRGCLRIQLNLCRPINIVAGTRPPSIYDILQEDRTLEKTLTTFYMPRDAVKAIHITNKTTTREVIAALLKKFKVVDNPHKFALYERTYDTGNSIKLKQCRIPDYECPLTLAIAWDAQGITNKRIVLQENDTADIQWDAFTLPELSNFLRILDKEEDEYKNQIREKYKILRYKMREQLNNHIRVTR